MQDSDRILGSETTLGAPHGDAPTLVGGDAPILSPSTLLAGRYEIIDTLGVGGMGSVYRAFDRQLTRVIALKTILPEMAASPAALKRFKQEILLAQQVVHKNVVRIFDIGEDAGTKFITMDLVQGVDLKTLIRQRGKLPATEAATIIRQVCLGLEAAHNAGVVHRDLKPQNIMMQPDGQILVMDFGIAYSGQSQGMTQTGAFLGTPEYMSPEQARAEEVDARSDIFSLGLIFYEMLTGQLAFHATTTLETMFKRTKERAIPPVEIDRTVPKAANDIVTKCLEIERERRYQSVAEMLFDLDTFDPSKKVGAAVHVKSRLKRIWRHRAWAAGIALILLLAVVGLLVRTQLRTASVVAPHGPVTVLVADFSNSTGDPVFDGALESMVTTAMEEASFVNTYNRGQARTLLARLQNGAAKLDEPAARLIAIREGVSVVITGSIVPEGAGYKMSLRAVDAVTGKVVATREVDASSKEVVLAGVGRLVSPIRIALGDTTTESAQLAAAETYTAGSLEAAHVYALGQENQAVGKWNDAIRYYQQAAELDPNLGRAYAGLALASVNLKKYGEAGDYFKKALTLVDRMSEREKYRTLGTYYLSFARNYEAGIDALRKLVSLYPVDGAAYNNLSIGYVRVGNMAESAAASRRAIEISPGNLQRRYNYAIHSMYAGDLNTATAEAERILQENAGYEVAYLPLALSALLRGDLSKATETYSRLEKVSSVGASLSRMGQADLEIYSGHYQNAIGILAPAIAADEKSGSSGERAYKLVALAEADNALGRKADAASAVAKAVQASSLDDGIYFLAARVMIEAGDEAQAKKLAQELEAKLETESKSLAFMINGDLALRQNRLSDAVDAYREAQKLHDSWVSRLLLGKVYVEASHFPEALSELETAEKRLSEATDLFDADTTTLRYLPPLYYWLGRAHEGLGTSDAARNNYQRFLTIRQSADSVDKLVADAKRRLK